MEGDGLEVSGVVTFVSVSEGGLVVAGVELCDIVAVVIQKREEKNIQ